MITCFLLFALWLYSLSLDGQVLPAGYPVLEESLRRDQLFSDDSTFSSFLIRPVAFPLKDDSLLKEDLAKGEWAIRATPLRGTGILNSKKPYWHSPNGMIPGKGGQFYLSGGVEISNEHFHFLFQPEIILAQNQPYFGYGSLDSPGVDQIRFLQWSRGDNPERYGNGQYARMGFGQSKFTYVFGSFEAGFATQNIWWGPGQWNALTFSNHAPGFPHFTFNTHNPVKTFFGMLEMQLISGALSPKRYPVSQDDVLNQQYHRPRRKSTKYLNALNVTVQPKWIKGLHLGGSRTVQTFSDSLEVGFIDILPVFWGLTKESVGSDLIGESDKGRDQQITVFFRYVLPTGHFEFYGEFGRRDHALNWRDFTLNPAHARAFLIGFNKLIPLTEKKFIQLRAESTHQKESMDVWVRESGSTSWHTNESMGGFTHWDQPLGVGIGLGSNVQVLELSLVKGLNKVGLLFERLENNTDFYNNAQLSTINRRPWVDLGVGLLFDQRWDRFLISSKLQMNRTNNYQWRFEPHSHPDFPTGNSFNSFHFQTSLIYFWEQPLKKFILRD
ncbi:MAG: capsule assembly Wzi family protein [Cyclobacteriaceae bacterium]